MTDTTDPTLERLLENSLYALPQHNKKEFTKAILQLCSSRFQMLPELAEVLEPDDLMKLFYVFAGHSLDIPSSKTIVGAIRDLDVFFSIKDSAGGSPEIISRLASKHDLGDLQIRRIVDRVAKVLGQDNPLRS